MLMVNVILPLALAASLGDDVPQVDKVTATFAEGRMEAQIATTLPVFREDLRTKIDGRNVIIYVEGAALDSGKRTFGEGPAAISAYPRATYVKLEVPMPEGLTCAGPASVDVNETIVNVGMGCKEIGAASSKTAEKAATQADAKPARAARESEAPSEAPAPAKEERDVLQERTAAAPKAAALGSLAKEAAKTEPLSAKPIEALAAAPVAAAPVAVAPAAPTVTASPIVAVKPAAPSPSELKLPSDKRTSTEAVGPRPTESTSPAIVGLALLLLAGTAFYVYRRRRQAQVGMIRILETASLGPKRALVIAEIDGEKMILGTSEAGIAVLTPHGRAPSLWGEQTMANLVQLPADKLAGQLGMTTSSTNIPAVSAPIHAPVHVQQHARAPQQEARQADLDDLPPENEGGLLSRLFRRNAAVEDDSTEGLGNMEDEFRDLLADSIEDEELRRRLQAGIGGRTS